MPGLASLHIIHVRSKSGKDAGTRSVRLPEEVVLKWNLKPGGVPEWLMVAVLKF